MHRRNIFRCALVVVAASAVIWTACGDDSPAGAGGGGGGGGNNLTIPAGTYAIKIETWTCGEVDTMVLIAGNEASCEADIVDEFLDYVCPVTVSGNTLSLDCTLTEEVFSGCFVTAKIDGSGLRSGTDFSISGTVTTTANPTGCDLDECFGFQASIMKVGDVPTACQYASQHEVDATITGGPFAGARPMDAGGFSSVNGNAVSFQVFATDNPGQLVNRTAAQSGSVNLDFTTPYIDPQTLPQTLPVVAQQFGVNLLGGPEPVQFGYSEYRGEQPFHSFFADSVLSGSLTVNELTADHIAGSMNLTVRGMETSGQSTSVSTRSIVGGYFVLNNFFNNAVATQETQTVRRIFAQKLRESLRYAVAE